MLLLLYISFLPILVLSQRLTEEENEELLKICGKQAQSKPIRRSMHTPQVARAASPWVVRLEYTKKWFPNITMEQRQNTSAGVCSGTMISPRHVLTAAHCVAGVTTKCTMDGDVEDVKYDPFNLDRLTILFTESCGLDSCKWGGRFKDIQVQIKKAFVSKAWTGDRCEGSTVLFRGDVAVFELAEDVPYSDHVHPACLNKRSLYSEEEIDVFGYGIGPSITDKDDDTDEMRHFKGKIEMCPMFDDAPDIFCFRNEISATCSGDSGSGLMVYDKDNRAHVIAPLSGGYTTCQKHLEKQLKGPVEGKLSFATQVKHNLYWICAATGICVDEAMKNDYRMYQEKGLTDFWYKTFEPLTGKNVYI